MPEKYESLHTPYGQSWIRTTSLPSLRDIDSIVFDCDGVLVDASKSYDATAIRVVDRLVQELLGIKLPWKELGPPMILQLRRTGLFNNDWDTTYALTMFSALAVSEVGSSNRTNVAAKIRAIINEFTPSLKKVAPGHVTVNRYLHRAISKPSQDSEMSKVQEALGYPGSPPRSFMATVFDEVYHGPRLYRQMYGTTARYYRGKGLIERERVLVRGRDLDSLNALLGEGHLAIATGRPFLPAKHVLKSILTYFNPKASIFLGDIKRGNFSPLRKPSGRALVRAHEILPSNMMLYVGDSTEDIMMVENAGAEISVLSAGVYGTSIDKAGQARLFRNRDVDLILPTARSLPAAVRLFKK